MLISQDEKDLFTKIITYWNKGTEDYPEVAVGPSNIENTMNSFKRVYMGEGVPYWIDIVDMAIENDYIMARDGRHDTPMSLAKVLSFKMISIMKKKRGVEKNDDFSSKNSGFYSLLEPLIQEYGHLKFNKYKLDLIAESVEGSPYESVKTAIKSIIRSSKFAPTANEVIAAIVIATPKSEVKDRCNRCWNEGRYARSMKPEYYGQFGMAAKAFRCECHAGRSVSSEFQSFNPSFEKYFKPWHRPHNVPIVIN